MVLAGVAALAYYAYTRMTEEQKKNIVDTVKKQGRDILGRIMPGMKAKNDEQAAGNM